MSAATIQQSAAAGLVRYASVWEDADVLCEALAPVARGGRLLSIASAGDNALALLTLDPAEVVAVDLNPAQLACLELRIAAFRRLDAAALRGFLGAEPAADRLATYRELRGELPEAARAFWDARPREIAGGVSEAGRFERYLRLFRRRVLPLIHSARTRAELLRPREREERLAFYERCWDTFRWRCLFRLFFSRALLGRAGRDPSFFRYVEGSVAERLLARTKWALTELPVHTNPYLVRLLTGAAPPAALPRYLRPEQVETIRGRLERLRLVSGRVEEAAEGRFDGFNLSDIFEYMSPTEHERCYSALLARARPGARLVYWNLLAPRGLPAALRHRARPLAGLAAELHARDRAWFYQALHVDEVLPEAAP